MAANMPQMVPNGQMMLLQQQQQQQPPQIQQQNKQLNNLVYSSLMQSMSMAPMNTWHSGVSVSDRFSKTVNLVTGSLLAYPNDEWQKICRGALEFEKKVFMQSPDKQSYDQTMEGRVAELVKRRQNLVPDLQSQVHSDAARQVQLQAAQQQRHQQQQQQQMLLNQMAARGISHAPQHGFPPLQNPMQMSAMPQQPQQIGMGMAAPGMLQNRQDQRQFPMQMAQARQQPVFSFDHLSPQDRARVMAAQHRNLMQQRPGMPANVMPQSQHQGQMNPALMATLAQQPVMLAQQTGQMVMPAGTAPGRNVTPGAMAGLPPQATPGHQPGPNQATRPSPMQQAFGVTQVKMDPAAAQAQTGIRAVAGRTMQNQQAGLATANAPQPPVPMGQSNGQPNPSMAATLNPQFNHQNNTRPPSLGNMSNPAMAGMNVAPDARVNMDPLGDAAMRELIVKWQTANGGFQGPKQGLGAGIPGQLQAGPGAGPVQAAGINPNQKGNGAMPPMTQPVAMQQQQLAAADRDAFFAFANSPQGRASMSSMDVPQVVLSRLRGTLPAEIKKWAQLRQFYQTHPGVLPPAAQNQLNSLQLQQFKSLWDKKKAMMAFPAGPQPPNGPIPPQQAGQLPQLPPGVQLPHIIPVTPQEIEGARQRDVRFRAMPDEAVTEVVRNVKRNAFVKRAWEHYSQSQQARANNNTAQVAPTPTGRPGGVAPPPHPSAPQGAQPQAAQPKSAGTPAAEAAPTPASATFKQARAPPNPSPAPAPKNLKRPNPDNAGDAPHQPKPGPPSDARPQPPDASKLSTEQLMKLSAEQLAKVPADQFAKLTPEQKAIVMRSRVGPGGSAEAVARLKQLLVEGQQLALQELQQKFEMPISAAELEETRVKIKEAANKINQLRGTTMPNWYRLTKDDSRARMFFKTRWKVARQFTDGDSMAQMRDSLTISKDELDQFINMIESMLRDLDVAKRPPGGQGGPAAQAQGEGQRLPPQPAPLNAARSPAGNPEYFGEQRITQANLVIPPARKKQKTRTGQASPPAAQQQPAASLSPQVKPPSPAAPRKAEAPKPLPRLTCPEPGCEMSSLGFPTEEALNAHRQVEHVKPFENPYGFAQEHMAAALGLDAQGNLKATPKPGNQGGSTPAAPPMGVGRSKQGQVPRSKADSGATPMSRAVSMQRQGSTVGAKAGESVGTPGRNVPVMQGAGTPQIPLAEDPWANATINPQEAFANVASSLENVTGNYLPDFGTYRSLTPNDTPESSKDSGTSEPTSDVPDGTALDIALSFQPLDNDIIWELDNMNMENLAAVDPDMFGEGPVLFSFDDEANGGSSKPFKLESYDALFPVGM